jgi:hypothetical protein
MTRVLIGDALVGEDERLQLRMNQFYDKVELAFKQRAAGGRHPGPRREEDVAARASLLVSYVTGTLAPLRQERLPPATRPTGSGCSCRCCWLPDRPDFLPPIAMDATIFALLDDASPDAGPRGALAPVHRPRRRAACHDIERLAALLARMQEALARGLYAVPC